MPIAMAHAHAAVERKMPRLALVPRDQMQAARSSPAKALPHAKRRVAHDTKREHSSHRIAQEDADELAGEADDDDNDADSELEANSEKHQLRLGERFLRMMAVMARLSRMPLDVHGDDTGDATQTPGSPQAQHQQQQQQQQTALEKIVQKKEAQRLSPHKTVAAVPSGGGSPGKGAAAPLLVPVNAATEPLRPHLTFEISMLLPPPIDTRQSSLQSPIRRKQLQRRRRRRRRPREKRSWQTSHATWAPRASADYVHERSLRHDSNRHSSKLMDKFAQLKRAAEAPTQMCKSSSTSALHDRKYLYAFPPLNRSASAAKCAPDSGESDEDDSGGDGSGESGDGSDTHSQQADDEGDEDEGHEQRDARSENNEPTFSSLVHSVDMSGAATPHTYPRNEAAAPTVSIPTALDTSITSSSSTLETTTVTVTRRQQPLFHQPAWISPELKTWLAASGMFQTRPRRAVLP